MSPLGEPTALVVNRIPLSKNDILERYPDEAHDRNEAGNDNEPSFGDCPRELRITDDNHVSVSFTPVESKRSSAHGFDLTRRTHYHDYVAGSSVSSNCYK